MEKITEILINYKEDEEKKENYEEEIEKICTKEVNEEDLIECTYGHHLIERKNFTSSGLNKLYYTICRSCKNLQMTKYRHKNPKKFNDSRREYYRIYQQKKRAQNKAEKEKGIFEMEKIEDK
jgi:hypothetical protein